jgi:amino acid transporter
MTTISDTESSNTPAPARVWSIEAVQQLGLSTTVDVAASIIGISRTKAYALAKSGQFPVRLVRVGRRYIVPTTALLNLLTAGSTNPPAPTAS